jgi:predicted pyridoxine 5'-phosphate oxidase superfamily flavin-nucleotide-binding protein
VVEDDPALLAGLADPAYKARPERAIVFDIEAWDVNCPKHILPRYTEEQIKPAFAKLEARTLELEAEVERLKSALAAGNGGG